VFESTGSVCPNCAAQVGNVAFTPKGKDSGLSVMPLAKSSGQRRGILEIDGSNLQVRDRQNAHAEGVDDYAGQPAPSSGLAIEARAQRPEATMAPEPPPQAVAAASGSAQQSGWAKPIIIVVIVIAVAIGGKYVMDYFKGKGAAPAEAVDEAPTL
jgi:hypothetical protein